jgi:hypothetical protein
MQIGGNGGIVRAALFGLKSLHVNFTIEAKQVSQVIWH